jgi:hypothetical protein
MCFRGTYPLNPAITLFVSDDLSLPELSQESLVAGAECRSLPCLPGAAADSGGAPVSTVIPRADPTSVQVLG